jgi:GDP-mannose mannosyl hydrolase
MAPSVSILAARQNRSKDADTSSHALPTGALGIAVVIVVDVFMALLSFPGFDTPSLPAQGEQRRSTYFNIGRDIPDGSAGSEKDLTAQLSHKTMTDQFYLSDDEFSNVVRLAPLVSLDLIIRDSERKVLLGLRTNEPAKDYYFVPGGAIRKNEPIEHAFARILETETGCRADHNNARLLGVFQHFYPTNRFGDPSYGTHYVVLAYELKLDKRPTIVLDHQHSMSKWMDEAELLSAKDVHENTKAYFR